MATCACVSVFDAIGADHLECFVHLYPKEYSIFPVVVMFLIEEGKVAYLQCLLARGEGDKFPRSAVEGAVEHRRLEILKLLWTSIRIDFDAALREAIDEDLVEYICFMVKNRRSSFTHPDYFLSRAAEGGHKESYHTLVSLGFPGSPQHEATLNRAFTLKSI